LDQFLINLLNGISSGLLLFMLSSGLTLIFSMMGVLNFAHASFYMLGAYFAYTLTGMVGFWAALLLAPLLVGGAGALFERGVLRKVHKYGHVAELLVTFGLSYVLYELVQLIWGRTSVPFTPPEVLQGTAFTFVQSSAESLRVVWGVAPPETCKGAGEVIVQCSRFPLNRAFLAVVAILGPSLDNLIAALGVFAIPDYARIVRGSVLSAREKEYVEAARCLGAPASRIMFRHILPNVIAPIIVLSTLRFGGALLAGSGLSALASSLKWPTEGWE